MQYQALLAGMIAASATTASALNIPRQAEQANFTVSDLSIGKDATNSDIAASLQVASNGAAQGFAKCGSASSTFPADSNGDDEICPVGGIAWDGFERTVCALDSSFAWSIAPIKTPTVPQSQAWSLQINYTQPDGTVLTGCRLIPEDQFLCDTAPTSPPTYGIRYQGPTGFNVSATSAENACVYV